MPVGSLYHFEHESTKRSCVYLGFSENSITLAADTLLRNTNKKEKANKGLQVELPRDEIWLGASSNCPCVEDHPGMFLHKAQSRTRLILRNYPIACRP